MIRNSLIAVIMAVSATIRVGAQSAPGIVLQDDPKCFVCGRTLADFTHLHDQALQAYADQIGQLSARISEIEQQSAIRYRRIVAATRGNPNMALTVDTVRTDVPTFSTLIPLLDEILEFHERYGRRLNLGDTARVRLSDVVAAMENPPLPEQVKAKQELETVQARQEAYRSLRDDFLEFPLFRVTTKLSSISANLANIEDLKKQSNNRLARLLSEARSVYRSAGNQNSVQEIVEQFKQRIYSDSGIEERHKDQLYNSFVADFLELTNIEYSFYLCPVCLSLLKNAAPSGKYRVWRFDKNTNRWDTTLHDFP